MKRWKENFPNATIILDDCHESDDRTGWNDERVILLNDGNTSSCIGYFCKLNKIDKNKPWHPDHYKSYMLYNITSIKNN